MARRGLSLRTKGGLIAVVAVLIIIAMQKGTDRTTSFTLCSATMTQVEEKPRLVIHTSAGDFYATDPDVIKALAGEDGGAPKIGQKFGGAFDGLGEHRLVEAGPPKTTVGIASCK